MRLWMTLASMLIVLSMLWLPARESVLAAEGRSRSDNPLVGYWKLLSVNNINPDSTHQPRHGAHPAGLLIFDASGRYSLIVLTEGTPEEYKNAIEGNNADFGHYTVDVNAHAITFFMEHASHPELEGSSHTRYYNLQGDRLTYTTVQLRGEGKPTATYGEVVLERMK